LTSDQLDHYLAHGYVTVPGVLDAAVLAEACSAIDSVFAPWEPGRPAAPRACLYESLPYQDPIFNTITVLPCFREVARQIIGGGVFCEQSHLRGTYAGLPEATDQDLHVDLWVHTLLYPSRQRRFWQVSMILYYTDTGIDDSPTYVVPWEHTQDEFLVPNHRSRDDHPDLYEHERPVLVSAGSLLVYNNRTFHRGSRFSDPRGRRMVQFITFNPAGCEGMGYCSWAGRWSPSFQELLARTGREEQAVFGFPAPGHPYWDLETLRGVAARYPGIDLSAYEAALTTA
jgi:hypothetical protein